MKHVNLIVAACLATGLLGAASAAPPVKAVFNTAAKATRTTVPIALAGSRTVRSTVPVKSAFKDASVAREYRGPRTDSFGNVHTSTRRLAADPAHPGMRFDSKVMRTPGDEVYKTSTIIRSDNSIVAVQGARKGEGYLTGIANSSFAKS